MISPRRDLEGLSPPSGLRTDTGGNILQNSSNVTLPNAQLNAAGRDLHIITNIGNVGGAYSLGNAPLSPMALLGKHCAVEATHQSETSAYAPRCKEGTRREILGDIMSWTASTCYPTENADNLPLMAWLSGPAGGGKTCIQREVIDRCRQQGTLAASYFFSTRVPDLDTCRPLASTISNQLCSVIPGLQAFVEDEIRADSNIFDKSLEHQFERLVCRPLNRLEKEKVASANGRRSKFRKKIKLIFSKQKSSASQDVQAPHRQVIVIDGLDECRSSKEQIRIIRLFAEVLTKNGLPFVVIMASRPEYDIRSTFDDKVVKAVTKHIRLEDYGCDTDIEDYLIDALFDIRSKHPSASKIPPSWPSKEDIQKVVEKASGQFIYASTLITFVNNPRRSLVELFALAVNYHQMGPSAVNPFTPLDALYTMILESAEADHVLLKRLLHGLTAMLSTSPDGGTSDHTITTAFLDDFYDLNPGTADTTFCDLHSIIHIPHPESHSSSIRFHHKTLEDYLWSPERSGKFYQPLSETYEDILELCTHHVRSNLSVRTRYIVPRHAQSYSTSSWPAHALKLLNHVRGTPLEAKVGLKIYSHAIGLLPWLASRNLSSSQRNSFARSTELSSNAVRCAIEDNDLGAAAVFLSMARSIAWTQALRLGSQGDLLSIVSPPLSRPLRTILRYLSSVTRLMMYQDLTPVSAQETHGGTAQGFSQHWERPFGQNLEAPAPVETFPVFLPLPCSSLTSAKLKYPVVLLNANERGCNAVIMRPELGFLNLPLPSVSITLLRTLKAAFQQITVTKEKRASSKLICEIEEALGGDILGHRDSGRRTTNDGFRAILATLWVGVVGPVVEALQLEKTDCPKRIWWCPTGHFLSLPFHAAGIYPKESVESDALCILDFAVSSYCHSPRDLLYSPPQPTFDFKLVAIIEPDGDRHQAEPLPETRHELRSIEARVPSANNLVKHVVTRNSPAGVVDTIAHGLKLATFVHFACHSLHHPSSPLQSRLLGEKGLTMERIINQCQASNRALAYLSAGQTAVGTDEGADVSIVDMMMFAGFRGVVGTMWSMQEGDAPIVTDVFYRHLFRNGTEAPPDSTDAAFGLHLGVQELRRQGKSFARWVPFVHYGI